MIKQFLKWLGLIKSPKSYNSIYKNSKAKGSGCYCPVCMLVM